MKTQNGNRVRRVFGFAIRERDWSLAGLLAVAAAGEPMLDSDLRSELDRMPGPGPGITLGALRALGHLLRAIARLDRPHD